MPPASLMQKVLAYELSQAETSRKRKSSKNGSSSGSTRIVISKATLKRAREVMPVTTRPKTKKATSKSRASSTAANTKSKRKPRIRRNAYIDRASHNRSKCLYCRKFIKEEEQRIKIGPKYYHTKCLPEEERERLLPEVFARLPPIATTSEEILKERSALVRTLTSKYSKFVSQDKIHHLVEHLPRWRPDVEAITGSIPELFDAGKIVTVAIGYDIQDYVKASRRSATDNSKKRTGNSSEEAIVIDDSDDEQVPTSVLRNTAKTGTLRMQYQGDNDEEDDEVLCEETLTNAEVIQKKFDQAAANGEILTID